MFKCTCRAILCALTLCVLELQAVITETKEIQSVTEQVDTNTIVFFNIAEVLTDSQISLGTQAWRKYVKAKAPQWNSNPPFNVHDVLTWIVFQEVPHKTVETKTSDVIRTLQQQGVPTAALTSRGRTEWYETEIAGVDDVTEAVLNKMCIDFSQSQLPFVYIQMEGSLFMEHFRNGIFYSNHVNKGEFLKQLLTDSGYMPNKVVVVDDKRDSLVDIEKSLNEIGVPFVGFWYTRTAQENHHFSPMIANVQLQSLLFDNKVITDAEAQKIINTNYSDVDPDQFFYSILNGLQDRVSIR